MKDYECCRCGLIFQDEIGPWKEEMLCPDCGSASREVKDILKEELPYENREQYQTDPKI